MIAIGRQPLLSTLLRVNVNALAFVQNIEPIPSIFGLGKWFFGAEDGRDWPKASERNK